MSISKESLETLRRPSHEQRLEQFALEQLHREMLHLHSKSSERKLSKWEQEREQQLYKDLKHLLRRAHR